MKKYYSLYIILLCVVICIYGCERFNSELRADLSTTTFGSLLPQNEKDSKDSLQYGKAVIPFTVDTNRKSNTHHLSKLNGLLEYYVFKATETEHTISANNPAQTNAFHIALSPEALENKHIWLEYELNGVEDYTQVSRSINDQPAFGGYFAKQDNQWRKQSEKINGRVLKAGDNLIYFSAPESKLNYKVRNVSIRIENNTPIQNRQLIVNQPSNSYYYKEYGYLKGFVLGKDAKDAKLSVNGQPVRQYGAEFETLAQKPKGSQESFTVLVEALFPDGEKIEMPVTFEKPCEWDFAQGFDPQIHHAEKSIEPTDTILLTLGKARLIGDTGSVSQPTTLSITALRNIDFANLQGDMLNVTADHKGFRFLPHGALFEKEVLVGVPYDTTLLGSYSPGDIRTYYFDEQQQAWLALQVYNIDTEEQIIYSLTNHFTDMVNAIIQVPENPESDGFAPTSIGDLQAVNPTDGITVMEPPTANSQGTATMSYPIKVPAGRGGLQPNLVVHYSSEAGDGLLGLGWDLNISGITIDTRFGVPRYDAQKESEDYLLDGEQLLPTIHEGALPNRSSGDKQFFPKVESRFDQIIRHGTSPKNYWWEITDKNGTKYYYGSTNGSSIDLNKVLRSPKGDVAHWPICRVIDAHGNEINYFHSVKEQYWDQVVFDSIKNYFPTGSPDDFELFRDLPQLYLGKQLWLDSIRYMGETDAQYSLAFSPELKEIKKQKWINDRFVSSQFNIENCYGVRNAQFSARYGFKQSLKDQLMEIRLVANNNIFIKKYQFCYGYSPAKPVLGAIYEVSDKTSFAHYLDYYAEPDLFENTAETITIENADNIQFQWSNNGGVNKALTRLSGSGDKASGIGSSQSYSFGFGFTGSLGLGFDVFSKLLSGGWSYNQNYSWSDGRSTLIDINGDGLPDKVFEKDGKVSYRLHKIDNTGKHTFAAAKELSGVPAFLREKSVSSSHGPDASFVAYGGYRWNQSTSETETYFTDINGDGLPDIVHDGYVLENTNIPQPPVFVAIDADCILPVIMPNNEKNDSILFNYTANYTETPIDNRYYNHYIIRDNESYSYRIDSLLPEHERIDFKMPNYNIVKVFQAPEDRTYSISAPIRIINDGGGICSSKDGIIVSVEYNNQVLWLDSIKAGDYSTHTCSFSRFLNANTYLFFRVSPIENGLKNIEFNPIVSLTPYNVGEGLIVDGNNQNAFLVTDTVHFVVPFTGKIKIEGNYKMADLVDIDVLRNNVPQPRVVVTKTQDVFNYSLNVNKGDRIHLKVLPRGASNIKWEQCSWRPKLSYTELETIQNTDQIGIPVWEDAQKTIPALVFYPTPEYCFFNKKTLIGSIYSYEYKYPDNRNPLFGPMYKNWGQFIYKGDSLYHDFHGDLISVRSPKIDANRLAFNLNRNEIDETQYDPRTKDQDLLKETGGLKKYDFFARIGCIPFTPNMEDTCWQGPNEDMWISKTLMSCRTAPCTNMPKPQFTSLSAQGSGQTQTTSAGYAPNLKKRGITKVSMSKSKGYSVGIGIGMIGIGTMQEKGSSKVVHDMMDLNGDGYPDIINYTNIQYSLPNGNLQPALSQGVLVGVGSSYETDFTTSGANVNGNFQMSAQTASSSGKGNRGGASNFSVGFSSSDVEVKDQIKFSFIDVNGDGLPDILHDDGYVQYNLGYSFTDKERWNIANIFYRNINNKYENPIQKIGRSESKNLGTGAGFSVNDLSFSGGVSKTQGVNTGHPTSYSLMDVNGDGYIDLLPPNSSENVYFGRGGRTVTGPSNATVNFQTPYKQTQSSQAANLSISYGFAAWMVKIVLNGHVQGAKSFSTDNAQFIDIDGDGCLDYVESTTENVITFKRGKTGKNFKLKTVMSPLGGVCNINYHLTSASTAAPRRWVMDTVLITDQLALDFYYAVDSSKGNYQPGYDSIIYQESNGYNNHFYKDKLLMTFEYLNPYYDRKEKTFYGFEVVTTREHDTKKSNTVYRSTRKMYRNDSYYTKGLLVYEDLMDGAGRLYSFTRYTYQLKDSLCLANRPQDYERTGKGSSAPVLIKKRTCFFDEFAQARKEFLETYGYGKWGNLVRDTNYGDKSVGDIPLITEITYHTNTSKRILSIPEQVIIKADKEYRKRISQIDDFGNIKQIEDWLQPNGSSKAVYAMEYDNYGRLTQIKYPANAKGEQAMKKYERQTFTNGFILNCSNEFNDVITYRYVYNLNTEKPSVIIDANGFKTNFIYDQTGRLFSIQRNLTNPRLDPLPSNAIRTNQYDEFYGDNKHYPDLHFRNSDFRDQGSYSNYNGANYNYNMPYSLNTNKDRAKYRMHAKPFVGYSWYFNPDNPSMPLEALTFVDYWGRVVRTKKRITLNNNQDTTLCSGLVLHDGLGRINAVYEPQMEKGSFDEKDPVYKGLLNSYKVVEDSIILKNSQPPTRFEYDVLNRSTKTTLPDSNTIQNQYGFGADASNKTQFLTQTTDARGKTTKTFTNMRGQNTSVTDALSGITKFTYNPIGEMLSYISPEDYETKFEYDQLGRKTKRIHINAGTTRYDYDLANNLTKQTNADNSYISYLYNRNRLEEVQYSKYPEQNTKYTYGSQGDGRNAIGQVTKIENLSGIQEFWYNSYGNVEKNIRKFVVAGESNYRTYTTQWEYDHFNRLLKLSLPDGEFATYQYYKHSGQLKYVYAKYNNETLDIATDLAYDKYGNCTYLKNGNGVETRYTYDVRTQNLKTAATTGVNFAETFTYGYDANYNINSLQKKNTYSNRPTGSYNYNSAGKTANHTFSYDALNRLTNTGIRYDGLLVNIDQSMGYSPSGIITAKGVNMVNSSTSVKSEYNSYNTSKIGYLPTMNYVYYWHPGNQANQMDVLTNESDANGNVIRSGRFNIEGPNYAPTEFTGRAFNENNQMVGTTINQTQWSPPTEQYYTFDAQGQRAIKYHVLTEILWVDNQPVTERSLFKSYTLYVNPYFVVKDGTYSKHYYINGKRIGTHLGNRGNDLDNQPTFSAQETKARQNIQRIGSQIKEGYTSGSEMFAYSYGGTFANTTGFANMYFYHTDHLGSTSSVSNRQGKIHQQFDYLPSGEVYNEEYFDAWGNQSYNPFNPLQLLTDKSLYLAGNQTKTAIPNTAYRFNGKELDENTGLYDYGARMYDPIGGGFLSVDPMSDKYPSISPYAYCLNNPLRYIDIDGRAPGDAFKTKKAAAKDWAMFYNGTSILNNREFGSSIYKMKKDGITYYTYTPANVGKNDEVKRSTPPNGEKIEAIIHSHGAYLEGYDNNEFSNKDKWNSYNLGVDAYVATPNGSLKKYDPHTTETTTISTDLPSDPKDPDRKNTVAPTNVPLGNLKKTINSMEKYFDKALNKQNKEL